MGAEWNVIMFKPTSAQCSPPLHRLICVKLAKISCNKPYRYVVIIFLSCKSTVKMKAYIMWNGSGIAKKTCPVELLIGYETTALRNSQMSVFWKSWQEMWSLVLANLTAVTCCSKASEESEWKNISEVPGADWSSPLSWTLYTFSGWIVALSFMSAHRASSSGRYSASPALAQFSEAPQKPHFRGNHGQIILTGIDTSSSPRREMEVRR